MWFTCEVAEDAGKDHSALAQTQAAVSGGVGQWETTGSGYDKDKSKGLGSNRADLPRLLSLRPRVRK